MSPKPSLTPGMKGVGIFLLFGCVMAAFAGVTLIWQGTALDLPWKLNPRAHEQLVPHGFKAALLFLALSIILIVASVGWLKQRPWGWRLTVFVIAAQIGGDFANLFRRDFLPGATGIVIASTLLLYLLRADTRARF